MTQRLVLSSLLLLGLSAVLFAGGAGPANFTGSSNGSAIVLRWTSGDETGVSGYTLERRVGTSNDFILLTPTNVVARGSGVVYEFSDNTVFRLNDSIFRYRLTVWSTNGTILSQGEISVPYSNVNTVRRTWGSIKAMFR